MSSCYHPSLKELTKDDAERFTLKGETRYAKVVSVYDGDTCDVMFYRDEEMEDLVRYKCRMSGYDAPELDDEPSGELARDYLAHLCTREDPGWPNLFNPAGLWSKDLQNELDSSGRLVYVVFGREGKYGRPLATLYQTSATGNPPKIAAEQSINDMMKLFIDQLG